ncbi:MULTISPECIES: deoxyribose-phosphate aldolase [Megamonas]|uniref:deoxyribose-phosphate aldolase n=1 Tax=Megamonas TaxID=158846 RepID=UPI000E3FBE56|nr:MULTISPECIES: deoxyribose-phosphate aldolase [Megamonas]NJE28509.1 deoxyribose-phosphate aldolase [Megamonas funiformis]RGO05223.1 deoxyribose-phosphate aldolase [Megamonas rupellensis]
MNINKLIDHTALKPNTTKESILKLITEAKTYDFASVCVNPCWIELAHQELKNTDVKVCTVIGFPLGANTTEVKVFEAKDAIEKGAQEIDMVINIAMLKDKEYDYVENEIHQIVEAAKDKAIVKVIIETCLLTDEEKIKACELSQKAGADFVKTSTGFSTGGATVHDIALMRKTVGAEMGVKASGGVHTHEEALAMVEAGATRIGASAGVKLLK